MAVSWGRSERFKFAFGGQLTTWVAPMTPAVYSVTYKRDPINKPKSHSVLYFGEASDLSQEAPSIRQVISDVAQADIDAQELFVFFHPMPGSTRDQRSRIKQQLVGDYRPRGNDI